MLAEYIYLGDQLLAMIKPGENVYYFHNDHLGTSQVLTNDSQAIAWKAVYTPFGEAVPSVQTVDNPFRFPGQYYDPETGLHYNYFRYYNPQTGRYITPDPIGLEGGINLFAYVGGNPVRWIDPLGLVRGDKLYGFPKSFWQWYHRNVKRPGDPDLDLESAKTYYDEWKSLGKPGPEGKVAGDPCKPRGKGPRGGKGLKALGVLQFLPMLLDVYEAQKLADETGLSVWAIMYYNMLGAEIVIVDDMI
jgi:RHS repeat-associated protein